MCDFFFEKYFPITEKSVKKNMNNQKNPNHKTKKTNPEKQVFKTLLQSIETDKTMS